jgi:Arc/MetJ-type ribon-helix-helix transcriptional regulator
MFHGEKSMVSQRELVARIKRSKPRPGMSRSLTIRLPKDLYDRLEAYVEKIAAGLPGVDLTVSDVVRNLLEQSLVERVRAQRRAEQDAEDAEQLRREHGITAPQD